MLSYVIPSQDSSVANSVQALSPERNLSLNLVPQYSADSQSTAQPKNVYSHSSMASHKQVDAMHANVMAAESCDERTHLLGGGTPPRSWRQNNNNNNNFTLNNDSGLRGGGDCTTNDSLYDGAVMSDETNATAQLDGSDKPLTHPTGKKQKLTKIGSKGVGLKRVSFGSSKGSMVETLVFETPTPLSEHVELTFGFDQDANQKAQPNSNAYTKANMDDSGIEVQEELERSIVRVSIYQSSQPQQICPPEYLTRYENNLESSLSNYNYNIDNIMTAASTIPGYDRQLSTDSGWDNPFRPGGDLSREADEIVSMIRGGKPITPTESHAVSNGNAQRGEDTCNGTTAGENVTKANVTQTQSAQNGTNSHRVQSSSTTKTGDIAGATAQVSKQVVPGPTSASHVVIDEKKNKKKGCCVIQ